jgi:pyruvate kinase
MDADAVMLSGETATGNYPFRYSKMTQIIEAVEDSPLIQVPNTPQIKTNVLSLKQFVTTLQQWQMSSKLKQFVP